MKVEEHGLQLVALVDLFLVEPLGAGDERQVFLLVPRVQLERRQGRQALSDLLAGQRAGALFEDELVALAGLVDRHFHLEDAVHVVGEAHQRAAILAFAIWEVDGQLAELHVLVGDGMLALVDGEPQFGLIVVERPDLVFAADRHGAVAVDDRQQEVVVRFARRVALRDFDAERVGADVGQDDLFELGGACLHPGRDRRAERDGPVGIDMAQRQAPREPRHGAGDDGHPARAADEDQLVELVRGNLGIAQRAFEWLAHALDERFGQRGEPRLVHGPSPRLPADRQVHRDIGLARHRDLRRLEPPRELGALG